MSRRYGITISVQGFDPARESAIGDAVCSLWDISDNWGTAGEVHEWYGESTLGGGMSEVDFACEMRDAVWKANGGFCRVEVACSYLEDPPTEYYLFDKEEYEEYTRSGDGDGDEDRDGDKED